MALTKKSWRMVMFVVLMLLVVTQPAYSKRGAGRGGRGGRDGRDGRGGGFCKFKCYVKCIRFIESFYSSCVGRCLFRRCGIQAKTFSHPSFHCGVGCVSSKCYNLGAGNGNVPKECVSSCVNNCDANFAGDIF